MAKRIVSEDHIWQAAAVIDLDPRDLRKARKDGWFNSSVDQRIDVLDIYCGQCRQPYDKVGDKPCAAAESNDHLIGGPTGHRKLRIHEGHDCRALGCTIDVEQLREAVGLR